MMGRQRDDMAPAGGGRAIFVAKKASDRWRGRRRRVSSGFAAVRFEREQGRGYFLAKDPLTMVI
jgi:hypothetical protein